LWHSTRGLPAEQNILKSSKIVPLSCSTWLTEHLRSNAINNLTLLTGLMPENSIQALAPLQSGAV
jgi:hypothetical protein